MKLIVVGASGFVGGQVIRHALSKPEITSIVGLSRKPLESVPEAEGLATRFKNVIVQDYGVYPEDVMRELAGASACIWTVAIKPYNGEEIPFEEIKRVCQDTTIAGLKAMHDAGLARPFRFIYMSGIFAERDQTKTPKAIPEYLLMRGATENQILKYVSAHPGEMEACVVRPAVIYAPWKPLLHPEFAESMGIVHVDEVVAAMLQQAIHGIEKEPLLNDDLVRIGRRALAGE